MLEAVKQAVNSSLLETSIQCAENILINTSGRVDIMELNDAISYVKELAGNKVNIIWGTVAAEDFDEEKIVVTLIATGMKSNVDVNVGESGGAKLAVGKNSVPIVARKEMEIVIPTFLQRHMGKGEK